MLPALDTAPAFVGALIGTQLFQKSLLPSHCSPLAPNDSPDAIWPPSPRWHSLTQYSLQSCTPQPLAAPCLVPALGAAVGNICLMDAAFLFPQSGQEVACSKPAPPQAAAGTAAAHCPAQVHQENDLQQPGCLPGAKPAEHPPRRNSWSLRLCWPRLRR